MREKKLKDNRVERNLNPTVEQNAQFLSRDTVTEKKTKEAGEGENEQETKVDETIGKGPQKEGPVLGTTEELPGKRVSVKSISFTCTLRGSKL